MAQRVHVIPQPVLVQEQEGSFVWGPDVVVETDLHNEAAKAVATQFANTFISLTGHHLPVQAASGRSRKLMLYLVPMPDTSKTDFTQMPSTRGQYLLSVGTNQITIQATEAVGLFYGIQTLWQLFPPDFQATARQATSWLLPACEIQDYPRFKWRGMHLDVSRHFFTKQEVMKYLDYLAAYKFNVFHWHLTDDQGWRIEIKRFPRLTEIGSRRMGSMIGHTRHQPIRYDDRVHEGYYTQDDVREVLAYAHARFITVVPEIEMPGHAQAAIASYPEYGCADVPNVMRKWGISPYLFNTQETTFAFLAGVLDEVMGLFPSRYIHIGGDEAIKQQWRRSPVVQGHIAALGLKDEEAMQAYFIKRIGGYLNQKGRLLMGWDEILNGGLMPGAGVMSWHGIEGGKRAARAGHPVVMSPMRYCYLDFYQHNRRLEPLCIGGLTTLKKVYSYEPAPKEFGKAAVDNILGLQGNVWTEYMASFRRVEEQIFPRMFALAEIGWSPRKRLSWPSFHGRVSKNIVRLGYAGVAHGPLPLR